MPSRSCRNGMEECATRIEVFAPEPGRARRAANFGAVIDQVDAFARIAGQYRECGRELPTVSEIRTLVCRAGRCLTYIGDDGDERRLNSSHIQLWDILLSFTSQKDWQDGHPSAWPGNRRLGLMMDISPAYIPRLLRELESAGAAVRLYTHRNRRHGAGGIDLSPTWFLLDRLRRRLEEIDAEIDEHRAEADARQEADADDRLESRVGCNIFDPREYKSEHLHAEACTDAGGHVDCGDEGKAEGGWPPPRSMQEGRCAPRSASLRDIAWQGEWRLDFGNLTHPAVVDLLSTTSVVFRDLLKRQRNIDDPAKAKPVDILEITRFLKDKYFPDMRPSLWTWAINNHGINAVLAVFLAVEKSSFTVGRPAFLYGVLRKAPGDRTFDPAEGLRRLAREEARH